MLSCSRSLKKKYSFFEPGNNYVDGDANLMVVVFLGLFWLEMKPGQPASVGVVRDKVQGGASDTSPENEEPLQETSAEG